MQRKIMTLAIFWLPIIGGTLLGGVAVGAWYGGNKILGLWLGFAGVVNLLLVVAIQLQQFISEEQSVTPDPDRPYISIVSLTFQQIFIQPGPLVIMWQIKNGGRTPANISDANITVRLMSKESTLPETPDYEPSPQHVSGAVLSPNDIFSFVSNISLAQDMVNAINAGETRLYVYGFVKYGRNYERGFIGLYNPKNLPAYGMFTRIIEQKYNRND